MPEAWAGLKRTVDLKHVDLGRVNAVARRLLPLVWWNLDRHGLRGPDLEVLRHTFAETWLRDQQLLALLEPVLAALRAAAVPTLLFKGIGLTLGTYPRLGLRPMADVDILIPPRATATATEVLLRLGARRTAKDPDRRRSMLHAVEFLFEKDGSSVAIDLHQHALWQCRRFDDDEAFWARAQDLPGAAFEARTLCSADHLLVVCVHGLRWNSLRPIQWVADALMLIGNQQDPVDWPRLVAEARRRRLILTVKVALRYLIRVFGAELPEEILAELEAEKPSLLDRLELSYRSRPPARGRGLFLHWCDHSRLSTASTTFGRLLGFPGYLREMWALDSLGEVPLRALKKALR